jgi:hypothetical protein
MFAALVATVISGLGGCSRSIQPPVIPPVIGPALGESTAPGPAYPIGSPPDAREVSALLHDAASPIANVAPATTAVQTTAASAEPTAPATEQPPTTMMWWTPGLPSGPALAPSGSTDNRGQSPLSMPSGNGAAPVLPIVTAPPPSGTPPSTSPNGPGGGAAPTPGVPRFTGQPSSGRANGTPASTPGG